ncbi:B12-binding domain-containing radical SAM protein [Paraclostridium sordellii]|uniref:B12-binding domain-containing radical SAM protein n=1 Tax=Paraclostridium sordellii TaxID=1505 RepID=UPI0005E7004C|nr:B12-binding domain-containing radical SAM protein [Paeniclostridium sordellii]MCQ4698356.1 B12-binding domain-containing radical SAM protein [Paeniclostridium sordellii]MDU2688299.1 B12-binding domain-containing radical SAM protein [Paeniclostridium sordellii]MDU4414562.1 B12-binding domain-containing radical SAM protein [Paeniclostridium sordellii]MDU6248049.1 B12-binding domain-containing radical SAM protein [Paeniclostridium sordellii]MDU6480696.1 B12-binding domain-containing radical SA
MKILLTTLNSKFIHTNLAIRYLNQMVKDIEDIEVDIREYTINNELDFILKDIYKNDYDVILFSTYIWNVNDIVKLCDNIKKVKPNMKIALGGPEVSYDSEDSMKKYDFVDYILYGEGELVFRDFVKHLKGDIKIEDVDGIVYRNNKDIIKNKPMKLLENLDLIPSPYEKLNKEEYENRIVYYETSRGCPFNCQYCLSSTLQGLRYFSIDRVKKDLKALIDARVSQIKFIDRTFNANKKFAMEIMKFLMENDNDYTTYHFEVTAHLLSDDMLEFLKDCKEGLFQFEIGVQTTNEKVLDAVGRRDDFGKLSYVVKKIASYRNIHQHLDLIAGLPYEDYKSFENSFNDVFNLGIEHLQLGFLKMIKGTGIRNRADEHEFRYKDYPPYEVLYNKYISYDQILKLKDIEEILERYFNSKNFVLSMRYIIHNFYKQSPFKFFEDFATYFNDNGYFNMSQGKNQLYKILLDFYLEKININSDLFKEIIKYDYISLGKTSNVPAFLEKVDIEDFKNRCHLFLQNEENILKYIPRFENTPAKQIIKYVHFEVFKYDILKLKDDIKTKLEPKESIVLFVYDDKKVFEKSKSYTVEI